MAAVRRGKVGADLGAAVSCHTREEQLGGILLPGRGNLLHRGAALRERPRRARERGQRSAADAEPGIVSEHPDAQPVEAHRSRVAQRRWDRVRVLPVGTADQRQHESYVLAEAGDRPDAEQVHVAAGPRPRPRAGVRDAPDGGPQADHAAVVGRNPERAAAVGADARAASPPPRPAPPRRRSSRPGVRAGSWGWLVRPCTALSVS